MRLSVSSSFQSVLLFFGGALLGTGCDSSDLNLQDVTLQRVESCDYRESGTFCDDSVEIFLVRSEVWSFERLRTSRDAPDALRVNTGTNEWVLSEDHTGSNEDPDLRSYRGELFSLVESDGCEVRRGVELVVRLQSGTFFEGALVEGWRNSTIVGASCAEALSGRVDTWDIRLSESDDV